MTSPHETMSTTTLTVGVGVGYGFLSLTSSLDSEAYLIIQKRNLDRERVGWMSRGLEKREKDKNENQFIAKYNKLLMEPCL